MGKGRLPGRAALLHRRRASWRGARSRSAAHIGFTGIVTFKNSADLRAIAKDAAGGPLPGRDRRAVSRAHSVSRQAQRAGLRGRDRQDAGRGARRLARRDRAPDHGEFLPIVRKGAAPGGGGRMNLTFTILGLRLVRRRAAARHRLGRLRSRTTRRTGGGAARCWSSAARGQDVTRVLVDTGAGPARAAARRRASNWLDAVLYTHEHADHTHGIDDLRGLFLHKRRRVDVYADDATSRMLMTRFAYCFVQPAGSDYPPILNMHGLKRRAAGNSIPGRAGRSRRCRSCRSTATSSRSASASAMSHIPAT